ncbi:hypothetical protein IVB12_15860 [Bradyrhizobium sp. 179]|uniref:hypothetical protein n=1 Tax=Bradyrhizobium sp. 179 TaxID=2782648 RepID=UPI001FFBC6E7|nr:hypothetical protein [Bradyrhizobium sp. 179]MCK1543392.1 hypothetical protein [Bradyrhizobium sp. 179]
MTSNIQTLRASIATAIDARIAREDAKSSMTSSNKKKLTDVRDVAQRSDDIASLLLACNFDAASVNLNVYSVEKMLDIAQYACSASRMSQYCNALFDSALVLEKASIEITRDVVAALCTNDIKTKFDAKIKSTRVQKAVSKSTVATQHNSTINAYLALNMLNVTRNANNDECFTLNRENAAVKAIAERKQIKLSDEVAAQ